MEEYWHRIKDQLIAALLAAAILAVLAAAWQLVREGGVISLLGGVTVSQLQSATDDFQQSVDHNMEALANINLPENAIIMADRECSALGKEWHVYTPIAGRFPIGTGSSEDARGETQSFTLGSTKGTYEHQLTVPEMPSHHHGITVDGAHPRGCGGGCPGVQGMQTSRIGGNAAHNNMPPYLTLNFCIKKTSGSR